MLKTAWFICRFLYYLIAFAGLAVSARFGRREPSMTALFRYADATDKVVAMIADQKLGIDLSETVAVAARARELALSIAAEKAGREDLLPAILVPR